MTGNESQGEDGFDEYERTSDEDVLRLIQENLEPDTVMPDVDALIISDFLNDFNVKGADYLNNEDIEILWNHLNQNPSMIKDFTYVVSDIKTELTLSQFPVPVAVSELIEYSQDLGNNDPDFSLRLWMIDDTVVPNLKQFGFSEKRIRRNALGEIEGHIKAGEATRFLGWLAGQRFMRGVEKRFVEYIEENEITRPKISHLGMVCTQQVVSTLDSLDSRRKSYRSRYTMESEATPKYDDVLLAVNGVYNMCNKLLIGNSSN